MQLTINLCDDLYAFVRKVAERETRPVSLQVRHFIAEAARRAGNGAASLQPWPPPLPISVTAENLTEAKEQLAELEAERDQLENFQNRDGLHFLPRHDARLRYLRDTCKTIRQQVEMIERGGRRNG